MKNFKEIAEKCLSTKLAGTFIIQGDKNWHSSYLQKHAILGHEIPGQYVLGPGVIYNEIGQCISNEKTKIIDFIPDNMENFKEIAEKCLAGELSGTFVLKNGEKKYVNKKDQTIRKDYLDPYSPYIIGNRKYSRCGVILPISNEENPYDIVDFIPDQMVQTKIEINIPEGKIPIMEQTEKGVIITWKEKELTYGNMFTSLFNRDEHINSSKPCTSNHNTNQFNKKVEVLRKLTNIRNYFGKYFNEDATCGWVIRHDGTICGAVAEYSHLPVFTKKEHAEQAIRMLGDELKYLFTPW